ncbi:MAG: TAXI family TRAP transporter solute-binding subunit [Alphaproteobacteria bacterium]|nr:TAXI family TRAP transporter solute-binding subunit [Alphaproteobacteria bacterium]
MGIPRLAAVALAAATAAASLATAAATAPALAQVVAIGSGSQGTWTYSASAAIAKIAGEAGVQMRVQPYAGTSTFVPLLNTGELDFGLTNHLEATLAIAGEVIYDGRKNPDIRAISVLAPLTVAIYVRADSPLRTVADLKGKRFPTEYTAQRIIHVTAAAVFANAGLGYEDVRPVPVPNIVRGADEFAAGNSDAFFFALGAAKVQETHAKVPTRLLGIDTAPAAMERMRRHVPVAYAMRIAPSPTQIGVTEPTDVMAYDYLALASAKLGDEIVYRVVKAMHDNPDGLAAAFAPLRGFVPGKMAKDLGGVMFHPGAIKFLQEKGQWSPRS